MYAVDEATEHREVTLDEGKHLAGVLGSEFYEASCVTAYGVSEMFDDIIRKVKSYRTLKVCHLIY